MAQVRRVHLWHVHRGQGRRCVLCVPAGQVGWVRRGTMENPHVPFLTPISTSTPLRAFTMPQRREGAPICHC